jgi:hypothetical protein
MYTAIIKSVIYAYSDSELQVNLEAECIHFFSSEMLFSGA